MTVPLYNLTDTWNNSGTAFTAIKMNVTNTAFDNASRLVDFQFGGSSCFRIEPDGNMVINQLTSAIVTYALSVQYQGTAFASFATSGISFNPNAVIGATQTTGAAINFGGGYANFTVDGAIYTLAQRSGTNAQRFGVYNTYTDGSNYERAVMDWITSTNVLTIGEQIAGTGSSRNVDFMFGGNLSFKFTNGATMVQIQGGSLFQLSATQPLSFNASNTVAISSDGTSPVLFIGQGTGAGNRTGWYQWGGQARVTSDVNSNNTTTLAIATGLSVALQAGRTYSFEAQLSFTCTAAQGIRAAMVASGGLTATNIIYDGWIVDSAANGIKGNAQATALGGVVANAATTGTAGHVVIRGTITVNVAGNLQVHFAQSVAAANNTTVKQGSHLLVQDMP